MIQLRKLLKITLLLFVPALLSAAQTTTADKENALAVFYVLEGNVEKEYNTLVEKEIQKIGFVMADPHHRVNDQYEAKYGSTQLDVLSFLPAVNDDLVMKLFNIDPRLAGFSPFNMLIYKRKSDKVTHVGHLMPHAMLDILGITDKEVREKFIASFDPLDKKIETYFRSKGLKFTKTYIPYHNTTQKKMLNFEYTFDRPDDLDEFLEEIQNKFELAFIDKHYLIAGFHNFMDTDNGEEILEKYDAFWSYSLCHLTYSYNVFDTDGSRPDAGLFAPCTMYVYIQKDSNKMVIGMPTLANVKNTLNITSPKRIGWMNRLDLEIPQILTSMGMQAVENVNPLKETPKPVKIDTTPPTPVAGTVYGKDEKPEETSTVAQKQPQPKEKPLSQPKPKSSEPLEKQTEQTIEAGENTVHIIIPKPPKAPKPIQLKIENEDALNSRAIKFSKRVPPGYIPLEQRKAKTKATNTRTKLGQVDSGGRIATYLRAPYMDVKQAEERLKKAGFKIISIAPLDKKKELTVIVFTNDALEKFAADHNSEFLASLRLLVDKKDNHITVTNPLYLAKAFMPNNFDAGVPTQILEKITDSFKGMVNSKDKLKFQLLPKYQFMNGMPRYTDMVEVALGDDLAANIQGKKQVVFQQKLPNGAILFGMKFRKRTQKFPYRIGTNNAALLPYPVLIKNGKAYIMDPKYYISVMYPKLQMSEFMTIATVPDAIVKECQRVFRKKK